MKRRLIVPILDEPDTRFFRCPRCHAVKPEYRWTLGERERVEANGRSVICDTCVEPAQDETGTMPTSALSETVPGCSEAWDDHLSYVLGVGFCWGGTDEPAPPIGSDAGVVWDERD